METLDFVFLTAETILTAYVRHAQSLRNQIRILERMVEKLPTDESLRIMLDQRIGRLERLTAEGRKMAEGVILCAEMMDLDPDKVPMALSRDEWLDISPPIPTEWEFRS